MNTQPNSTQEYFTKFQAFRQELYSDALADTLDALIFNGQPLASFSLLSLSQAFQRQWSSLYAAVEDGQIDGEALINLLTQQVPSQGIQNFCVDVWPYPRPRASTLPQRQYIYQATTAVNGGSITVGYPYSTLAWIPGILYEEHNDMLLGHPAFWDVIRIPALDTFRRVLRILDVEALLKAVNEWLAAWSEVLRGSKREGQGALMVLSALGRDGWRAMTAHADRGMALLIQGIC